MPRYLNNVLVGFEEVTITGDGLTAKLKWYRSSPENENTTIAYNIYYATEPEYVFSEGPKLLVTNPLQTEATITDLVPGQLYYFSIRPIEYFSSEDLTVFPIAYDDLRYYPDSLLRQNISESDLIIPLLDVTDFPLSATIKLGVELINYSSVDIINKNLILSSISQRGYNNTEPRSHSTDGYDGYYYWSTKVFFYIDGESDQFDKIDIGQERFDYPEYSYTLVDGYKQVVKDLLTTDLSASDAFNQNFPRYDYAGWHRTDPKLLLNGYCVGSYIGGQRYCADGYLGVGRTLRGLNVQDINNQRQEQLLELDGEPVVLLSRQWSGLRCFCFLPSAEHPDNRCPKCHGTGFVVGYEQFFNPRRSDGRILVRFSPAEDDLKITETGLESEFSTECWTLTVPTIKDRDVIIRFDQEGNEEFRYEVISVTRNKMLNSLQGGQKFRVQRIRKFDPAYQIRAFRDTSSFPSKLNTSISFVPGIPPHSHEIVISEKITNVSQINQTTKVSQGHNHPIVNGQVMEVLGHTHDIILL